MVIADITQNFARIYRTLEGQGSKPTNLAKMIGYTTTAQLHSALEGNSILSTKAIWAMVEKLNVNPLYLFLGKGQMFLNESDEDEVDKMNKEIKALRLNCMEAEEKVLMLNQRVEDLEKTNAELLDISSALLKLVNRNTTRSMEESIKKISDTN